MQPRTQIHGDQPEGAKLGGGRFRRGLLVGALALVALVDRGSDRDGLGRARSRRRGGAAQITTTKTPSAPDFGPNVVDLRPEHADGARSRRRSTRSTPSRSTTRWAPTGTRCCSSPAPTAPPRSRCRSRSATTPRSPAWARSPTDVSHQRQGRGLQPLPRRRPGRQQLHRAEQLLAHAVQPDDQRQRAGQDGCRARANFWAVSQAVVDAPGQRHRRQPLADGLLHRRPAVRQRRLHRRLAGRRRRQRLAAAVATRATARSAAGRNGVWNQVFSGVVGAPATDFAAQYPTTRPTPRSTTTPVSREKPYLYVDDGAYNVRVPVRADEHQRHQLGRRP